MGHGAREKKGKIKSKKGGGEGGGVVTLRDQPQYREAAMCKAGCLCSLGCVALPCRCGLTHGTVIYLFIFFFWM